MFSNNKGFDATKLKAALKLASSRFDVAKNKKSALMKQNMREIAMLLAEEPPKEEKARIRTERLIKDDYLIEAYEILQLECQLLTERVQLLKHSNKNECPADLVP
ncbi:positive regulation of collateral sprouting (Partial), partial [Seminavis robusta]|eukprot:Sro4686_g354460.1 positive regulation of collateral sprouting (104) ;mRNA; f:808-1120